MLIRAIALSIALLIGLGTIIPLATQYAEAGATKRVQTQKKREWKGVKKYSKRWWQLYRAQEKRKAQLAARKRSLRLNQARLEQAVENGEELTAAETASAKSLPKSIVLPSGERAPETWVPASSTDGDLQFQIKGDTTALGSASISVVGPATGETEIRGRQRILGGVSTTALRRGVINQMVRENGWVVNDYEKEVGGKTVYVVVAQSQGKGGQIESRLFYFTEAGGNIYSVATNSSTDSAERIAAESEKVLYSLQGVSRPVQQAQVKGIIRERAVEPTPVPQIVPTQPVPCTPYIPIAQ
ncbi:MAG: hypothetical protein H0V76_07295 [Blastocatellia bacterium]|nr:hypothetical protein [Blastocatellia bacterium]